MPTPTFTIDAEAVGAAQADDDAALALTVTHASGWAGAISATRHLSRLVALTANLSCSSALTAGTRYTVATVALPAGYDFAVALGSVEGDTRGTFALNTAGALTFRPSINLSAGVTIYLRHLALAKYTP